MSTERKKPSLASLRNLKLIVDELQRAGTDLTATRLKRNLNIDSADFDEALNLGCEKELITCGRHNYCSLNGNFEIPESAYYDVISSAIEHLWLNQ